MVKNSSKPFFQYSKLPSPISLTEAPSTKFSTFSSSVFLLFLNETVKDDAPVSSTPIIFVSGLKSLNTLPTPEAKPPPPTGKIK